MHPIGGSQCRVGVQMGNGEGPEGIVVVRMRLEASRGRKGGICSRLEARQ